NGLDRGRLGAALTENRRKEITTVDVVINDEHAHPAEIGRGLDLNQTRIKRIDAAACRLNQRGLDGKSGALAWARAFGPNTALVKRDDMPNDGEAETEAGFRARIALVALPKPLEDVRKKCGTDPRAGVAHRQTDAIGDPRKPHIHQAAGRCEL